MYGKVSYLAMIAPTFNDELVRKLVEIDDSITVSMHMQAIDPVKATKMVKTALTNVQKMKIEEQKRAVRSGYDMEILQLRCTLPVQPCLNKGCRIRFHR